jgi:glyoxylase-like metal-dependent hydrolase (beta-lactamase superfamily II)
MAKTSKLPRGMREARRQVEKAFRRAEMDLLGLSAEATDLPPAASLAVLDEEIGSLHPDDVAGTETLRRRLEDLRGAVAEDAARQRYTARYGVGEVTCTRASGGERIYRVVATTFPGHENYVYLVCTEAGNVLVDTGSNHFSREDILRGVEVIRRAYGEEVTLTSLKAILVTHGHVDHSGDAAYFREQSGAPVMVHELDAPLLTSFQERLTLAAKELARFLCRAGVPPAEREQLDRLYLHGKDLYRPCTVDRRLRHGDRLLGRYDVIHTPGHCPGHLCLRVSNVLLVADQVLNPITPNISPQSMTPFNGLENYFHGLLRLRALEGIDHVLPAHANPIPNLAARVDEIMEHHQERLVSVQEYCQRPRTVADVTTYLFGRQESYNVLLSFMEAGAHVEYLYQHGRLRVANMDKVTSETEPVVEYVAV